MTDETTTPWPEGILGADYAGVRVFWIATQTMQELVDRLALILGEHMSDTDELKVTYNAMQSGWHEHPGHDATLFPLRRAPSPLDRAAIRVQRLRRPARPGIQARRRRIEPRLPLLAG